DPHHRERFQDAGLLEPSRIERLKTEFAHKLSDGCFGSIVVTCKEHDRSRLELIGRRHYVRAHLIEGLHHLCAGKPRRHGFSASSGVATLKSRRAILHGKRVHAIDDDLAFEIAERFDCIFGASPRQCQNHDVTLPRRLRRRCRGRANSRTQSLQVCFVYIPYAEDDGVAHFGPSCAESTPYFSSSDYCDFHGFSLELGLPHLAPRLQPGGRAAIRPTSYERTFTPSAPHRTRTRRSRRGLPRSPPRPVPPSRRSRSAT